MANNNTKELIQELFQGMDGFIQSKTVVGEPIKLGDTVLVPLMEVSCGMASGAFVKENTKKGDGGAGAMNSRITPAAMLVIQNGRTKLIRVKNEDALSKIIDMIPEAIDKITGGNKVSESAEQQGQDALNSLVEKDKKEKEIKKYTVLSGNENKDLEIEEADDVIDLDLSDFEE
ncbi:MAG: sporulation protein [Oribacterium parvum]|uniref:GerW family sporulation protein n=1 Tax=Oribacterium parvum TaxID=1501329 RepID=UPI001CB3CBE1|nr:GerW family sporulation protein [Oribacterium parvum]MBF1269180.1 sporulation protein [Oribacterium parvum]